MAVGKYPFAYHGLVISLKLLNSSYGINNGTGSIMYSMKLKGMHNDPRNYCRHIGLW